MPRLRVIVLDRTDNNQWRYALWADVPVARQPFYTTTAASAWKGATATDNANIQSGSVAETVGVYNVLSTTTLPGAQVDLQSAWTAYQTQINSYDPWRLYGSNWDGTTWTTTGAA